MKTIRVGAVALVAAGVLFAVSTAGADDLGDPPSKVMGSNPAAYCKGALSSVCSTVQPTRQGSNNYVVTVFAPSNTTISSFAFWSGTAATKLKPKTICKSRGKGSHPEWQIGTYYITRCTEKIKPRKHLSYCMSGLSRLPSLSGPDVYSVYVDAGIAGASSSISIPATAKCPKSVGKRKKHK